MRTIALLAIACAASVAQQPVKCPGPLTEAQLTDLVKSQVPEKRLHVIVQTCGIGFAWSDSVKSRLHAAGASTELLEDIRVHGQLAPRSYWQVMALKQADAEVVVRSLKDKGFPALMAPARNNLTRVLVGPYPDMAAMSKAKTELENAGFHPIR